MLILIRLLLVGAFFPLSRGPVLLPFFEVEILVLQGMCELMRQHRLLQVRFNPVEQIHGFVLRIVIAGHLFLKQRNQKRLEIKIARQQSELLEHLFGALQAFGILIRLQA